MVGVTWQLGQSTIVDLTTAVTAIDALAVLIRVKPNSAWLVLAGGVVGVIAHLV